MIGFAAETQNLESYARNKLAQKNLDMIVANDVSDTAIGFNSDDNAVLVIDRESHVHGHRIEKQSKSQLARSLIALIASALNKS